MLAAKQIADILKTPNKMHQKTETMHLQIGTDEIDEWLDDSANTTNDKSMQEDLIWVQKRERGTLIQDKKYGLLNQRNTYYKIREIHV